jgi:hypothetical protein
MRNIFEICMSRQHLHLCTCPHIICIYDNTFMTQCNSFQVSIFDNLISLCTLKLTLTLILCRGLGTILSRPFALDILSVQRSELGRKSQEISKQIKVHSPLEDSVRDIGPYSESGPASRITCVWAKSHTCRGIPCAMSLRNQLRSGSHGV